MPKCGFFQRSLDWKGLIFNGIVCHLKSFSFAKNGNLCTHIMKQKKGSKVVFVFCYLLKATYSNDRGRVETDLGRNTSKFVFQMPTCNYTDTYEMKIGNILDYVVDHPKMLTNRCPMCFAIFSFFFQVLFCNCEQGISRNLPYEFLIKNW